VNDFEYMDYTDSQRLAMLENRAAELERRLGTVPRPEYRGRAYIAAAPGEAGAPPASAPQGAADYQGPGDAEPDYAEPGYAEPDYAGRRYAEPGYAGGDYADNGHHDTVAGRHARMYSPPGPRDVDYGGGGADDYPEPGPNDRTEVLINRGRRNVRRSRLALWREHRRAIVIGGAAVAACIAILTGRTPGRSFGFSPC
jgi:hypothetical protein